MTSKAEGGLVEEEHARSVQQGAGNLAPHPLPQREVTDRLGDQGAQIEQFAQLAERRVELVFRYLVDGAVQLEGIGHRDVPDELVALPHHQRHLAKEGGITVPGLEAKDARLAGAGVEEAGEHLKRRRLACPVRPEEANDLALPDLERDAGHGDDLAHLSPEQAAHRGPKPRFALGHLESLCQTLDGDRRSWGAQRQFRTG